MKKIISENDAFFRLTALCAASEQCEWTMREKMRKWGITPDAEDRIIDKLYDEKYIDEKRFANAYARDKMRYSQWGRQKIDQGLRLLHISTSSRREALDALPVDEYCDILKHTLLVKSHSVKAENDYERTCKLIRFALGRGFEMAQIRECLPDMDEDAADSFDDSL